MLAEENPEFNHSPLTLKGNSVNLFIYVPDVDATIKKALNNRANLVKPAEDSFTVTGPAVEALTSNSFLFEAPLNPAFEGAFPGIAAYNLRSI